MPDTALTAYQFTIDAAIAEWLTQKETRTSSQKTRQAYEDTMQQFRDFLARGGLDLLSNPIDIARVAALWANMRDPEKSRHPGQDVSPNTYNQRLAILSSFYTFVKETYKLDVPNPIKDVKKRPVQAYASAQPLEPETVEQGFERINRNTLEGLRDYAILAVALYTGRRVSELAGLRGADVKFASSNRIQLTFRCKGGKIKRDLLDVETSAVLLEYLHAQVGKNHAPDAPIWVSYGRQNKGEAISTKTLSNICADYMDTSKVHTLRHTFAVGMIRSGAPITELSERLGHTDIKITQVYAKEVMGDENPYGEKLTARFGIKRKEQ